MEQAFAIDAEMQELIGLIGKTIVPRRKRNVAVWRTHAHSPYYSRHRYKRIA